jgi:hypothetical protein
MQLCGVFAHLLSVKNRLLWQGIRVFRVCRELGQYFGERFLHMRHFLLKVIRPCEIDQKWLYRTHPVQAPRKRVTTARDSAVIGASCVGSAPSRICLYVENPSWNA